ncbi:hypothetical protein [Streptomyces turgidiscabies]|uniref:hypothetical protein n=1 Tax=Streptomyces turgidiscabies TaxID=85558 RepID=UPI0038F7A411
MSQPQQDDRRIAIDDAFPVYRQRCNELFDENMFLRSQVAGLKRQISELSQLVPAQTPETASGEPEPAYGGPDLAAQPTYTGEPVTS